MVALRKESVDRNLLSQIAISETLLSLSARRAWIEIRQGLVYAVLVGVALRKESVDINYQANAVDQILPGVALRKESVDRNDTVQIVIVKMHASLSVRRAWIEIHWIISRMGGQSWSLSVRRAWIEMTMRCCTPRTVTSLSVRRAWIEIFLAGGIENLS